MTKSQERRVVAVWMHTQRDDALEATASFVRALGEAGIECIAAPDDRDRLRDHAGLRTGALREFAGEAELAVIFGGDGTILRAAEWAVERDVPLLGVNLGHVGFLAELETSDQDQLADRVVRRDYGVEERLTIQVEVRDRNGDVAWRSIAVNEVSVEKFARERMLELLVAIDGRPLSRWGCDGVLVATPTGSTAYAFSAGGPVVWPGVAALLVVPLSAHALFSRPVVLGPDCRVDVTLTGQLATAGVVWCDGRRSTQLREGMTVVVSRGEHPLRLARLGRKSFTDRLVKKFDLPVDGWRTRHVADPAAVEE